MASRPDPKIDLTDAEKRDLIAPIQADKVLPEKYRFVLFEGKREVEPVWNGKTRDVCTTVPPFQTVEHLDEPRAETNWSSGKTGGPAATSSRTSRRAFAPAGTGRWS